MKQLIILLLLFTINELGFAQTKQCECLSDSNITQNTTDCATINLKDGSKLYYQFNCDSIWLTLENDKKLVVFSSSTEYYNYTYRLGYQFAKEYEKSILFRSGCLANGPCNFVLVDKVSGKTIEEFGELIYDHFIDSPFYDFVIYFTDSTLGSITLDFIDSKQKINVPIDGNQIIALVPEYQFEGFKLKDGILTFGYAFERKTKRSNRTVEIDLKKYKIGNN